MFFDRYEIHIQAFVDFMNGKLTIFQSLSPQKHFKKYILGKYIDIKYFLENNSQAQARKSRNYGILSFVQY